MDANTLIGAFAGLTLSALLVAARNDCAYWLIAQIDGPKQWAAPVSGAVTGTAIFFAAASIWLLGGAPH